MRPSPPAGPLLSGSLLPGALLPGALLSVSLLSGLLLSGCALDANPVLVAWFGPPEVQMQEAWADEAASRTFDHGALDALLRAHVTDGWVDYAGLKAREAALDGYLAALASAELEGLGRDGRLALLLNAYNALTLKLILERYPLGSIKDIPADERWEAARWQVAGRTVSLDQLEHDWIRQSFAEPRIHFALVCAAIGCPPLRSEAYTAAALEAQLEDQTQTVHGEGGRWFRYAPGEVGLTKLYQWYRGDFEQAAGSQLAWAARYAPGLAAALGAGEDPAIAWLPYDWSLNDAARRPE